MTAYDMSQTYESRHVKEFLGINKDQLFHWIQTKKLMRPVIMGEGRGRRTRFSLDDLMTLALIKTIHEFGIELNNLKKIMASIKNAQFPIFTLNELMKNPPEIQAYVKKRAFNGSVWDYYRANREHLKSEGYSLEISQGLRLPNLRSARVRVFGETCRPMTEEEKKKIKEKRVQLLGGPTAPAFYVRALDGESQALLLSSGINPSEQRIDRTDIAMPMPSPGMVIIVNLLKLIEWIEETTKRVV
jgi:DNA-binding transcriptional MerR regulator